MRRWVLGSFLIAGITAVSVSTMFASDHYVIIYDAPGATDNQAVIDIGAETAGAVYYTVYVPGKPATPATPLTLNADNYARTPELGALIGEHGGIVQVSVPTGLSSAVLRQGVGKTRILLAIPPVEMTLGQNFMLSVGNAYKGAEILLGNPGGVPAAITVKYGTPGAAPADTFDVPAGTSVARKIGTARAAAFIVSTAPVFIQLVLNTGTIQATYLIPVDKTLCY